MSTTAGPATDTESLPKRAHPRLSLPRPNPQLSAPLSKCDHTLARSGSNLSSRTSTNPSSLHPFRKIVSTHASPSALLTFAQRTLHVANVRKTRLFYHHKPFPLQIRTLGELIMVRRKTRPGLSHRRLVAKTGIKIHCFRRWEFDRAVPSQTEWNRLRQLMNLPAKPALTFAQSENLNEKPETLGSQLRKRRLEIKMCLTEAAPEIGVAAPTLALWELNKVFPRQCYHSGITAFLGFDPFP